MNRTSAFTLALALACGGAIARPADPATTDHGATTTVHAMGAELRSAMHKVGSATRNALHRADAAVHRGNRNDTADRHS